MPAKSDRTGGSQVDSPRESWLALKRAEALGLAALKRSARNEATIHGAIATFAGGM